MNHRIFADREESGWMLVERLRAEGVNGPRKGQTEKPLVLAIPRGGIEIGAVLARGLGAELDVVLSRKLRAPHQPELALGAVSETGEVYLNDFAQAMSEAGDAYVTAERAAIGRDRPPPGAVPRRATAGSGGGPYRNPHRRRDRHGRHDDRRDPHGAGRGGEVGGGGRAGGPARATGRDPSALRPAHLPGGARGVLGDRPVLSRLHPGGGRAGSGTAS